ncbi:hypothetical protein C2E25_06930 [Geothermobacter hydrogeniphilus]|uniref:DUF306 domain-containing protein n=1 Tax=Geothermobacter hydrogeniphilus TaxID=1969733 RepID=A0A2K2HB07_9BACT|nr:META domain-containing protein [Geothermobacter hydrogeniphilus]PNU20447.1 hypothetical protein C2E25_06930 [Geothermobacter hydrogeniphilus]
MTTWKSSTCAWEGSIEIPKPGPKKIAGPILAFPALVLSACGTACPQATTIDLNGTSWALSELNGHPLQLPPGTGTPTMAFSDGMVRGSDGCNRFQGSFEQQAGRLAFGPPAATRRFCEEPGQHRAGIQPRPAGPHRLPAQERKA